MIGDWHLGDRPTTLAVGNEKPSAVHTCRADCLTSPAQMLENQFVSNTTGRTVDSILLILNPMKFTANFKTISAY